MTQPIGSIKTLIEIFGKDAFFEMIKSAPTPKNPKYKQLIAQVFAETKLNSAETVVNKFIELKDVNEIELLMEIKDGYKDIHRISQLKKQEPEWDETTKNYFRALRAWRNNPNNPENQNK